MKPIIIALVLLLILLQYELWVSPGGVFSVLRLRSHVIEQQHENEKVLKRNYALVAEIKDLKNNNEAIEEHARNDLGMVKKGEVFYQVVQH